MNYCKNCGGSIKDSDKFCGKCGITIDRNLKYTVPNNNQNTNIKEEKLPDASIDQRYLSGKTDELARVKITEELMKYGLEAHSSNLKQTYKGKIILSIIYSILNALIIALFFILRINIIIPIILFIINFILYFFFGCFFDNDYYILQKVKKNPYDKISTIVENICNDNTLPSINKHMPTLIIVAMFFISLIPFYKPFYIYEKNDNGYSIKHYVAGIKKENKIVIPSTHKGSNVTIIRGNAFANIKSVKEVVIPDTI